MDFEPGYCMEEKAAFADVCRRHGFRAEQFQFALSQAIDDMGSTVWLDVVLVVNRLGGCQRVYRAPSPGGVLAHFESDLRHGLFAVGDMLQLA